MKVSVLIANYNNGKYFKDCYEGLISQEYPNWEALILDDCSTDNSIEIIESLIQGDGRFRLIKEKVNRGVGYAKGTLAKIAKADILAVLDPDDALKPQAIGNLVKGFQMHRDAVGVYTGYVHCDATLQPVKVAPPVGPAVNEPYEYWGRGIGTIHHFFGFRRDVYEKTVGINPGIRNADDIDLYLKMEEHGRIFRVDEPVYLYRHARGSLSNFEGASSSWVWVMRVFMQNGQRRVEDNKLDYTQYTKLILERFLFCLREAKNGKDKKTFDTVLKDFRTFPFNRRMLMNPTLYKYAFRHFKDLRY